MFFSLTKNVGILVDYNINYKDFKLTLERLYLKNTVFLEVLFNQGWKTYEKELKIITKGLIKFNYSNDFINF